MKYRSPFDSMTSRGNDYSHIPFIVTVGDTSDNFRPITRHPQLKFTYLLSEIHTKL